MICNTQHFSILAKLQSSLVQINMHAHHVASCKAACIFLDSIFINFLARQARQAPLLLVLAQVRRHWLSCRCLCHTNHDLPSVRACKHVQVYLYCVWMHTRAPKYIPYHLLPIVVATVCCFKIVLQQNVRSMVFFAEDPWHLRSSSMSKIAISSVLLRFKAVRCRLERRR